MRHQTRAFVILICLLVFGSTESYAALQIKIDRTTIPLQEISPSHCMDSPFPYPCFAATVGQSFSVTYTVKNVGSDTSLRQEFLSWGFLFDHLHEPKLDRVFTSIPAGTSCTDYEDGGTDCNWLTPLAPGASYTVKVKYTVSHAGQLAGGFYANVYNPNQSPQYNATDDRFEIYATDTSPSITSIDPTHGAVDGHDKITIKGSNLGSATSVKFGGVAGSMISKSSSSISVWSPAHAAGRVTVTVESPTGNATTHYVYDEPVLEPEVLFLPVAGSVPGALGSFFRTMLQIHNPDTAPQTLHLTYHPQGQSPSPTDPSAEYVLNPNESRFWTDVVQTLGGNGLGTLDLTPTVNGKDLLAVARIYNDAGEGGTSGMNLDFLPESEALSSGDTAIILAPPNMSAFRFNMGVRALEEGAVVSATLRDASGLVKRTLSKSFSANSLTQTTASELVGPLENDDSITLSVTAGSAFVYAATVDNVTQDPSYQLARPLPATATDKEVIPVVGSTAGASGSFFRTTVQLHNPFASPVSLKLVFHPQGVNGSPSDPAFNVDLLPGQTASYSDIVGAAGSSGVGSLDIVPLQAQYPIVVSRIFNDAGTHGTTGMTLDGYRKSEAIEAGHKGILLAPGDTTRYRYNVGFRTFAEGAALTVTLRGAAGTVKKSIPLTYGADYFVQMSATQLLNTEMGESDSIEFTVNAGSVLVYGATVDNRTQDSSLQVARPR
jgi:hypothetical protein